MKPIPNPENKRVDFELVKGRNGKRTTIQTGDEEYDPDTTTTMSRGVGRCLNCSSVIENDLIYEQGRSGIINHQLYAVAYRKGQGNLEFRLPQSIDFDVLQKVTDYLDKNLTQWQDLQILPDVQIPYGHQFAERSSLLQQGIDRWDKVFNPRQLLTLVTYLEIINKAKTLIQSEYEWEKAQAIITYMALVFDRCVDKNCRLSHLNVTGPKVESALGQHSLNLIWNYPETNGSGRLWEYQAESAASDYFKLCSLLSTKPGSTGIPGLNQHDPKSIQIDVASADNLTHIPVSNDLFMRTFEVALKAIPRIGDEKKRIVPSITFP